MADLVDKWLEALGEDYPNIFEDDINGIRIGNAMSEYFHVYFNPDTLETELFVECGDPDTYASKSFIEKARIIAQEYYKNYFEELKSSVLELIKEFGKKDIIPDLIILPNWLIRDSQPRNCINERFRKIPSFYNLYGIPMRTHDKNVIRLESSKFGICLEKSLLIT